MPEYTYVDKEGKIIPPGRCIVADNCTDTFTVVVRSLHGIPPEAIRSLLQHKFEVIEVTHTEQLVVAERRD